MQELGIMRYVQKISVIVGIVLILAVAVFFLRGGRSNGPEVRIVPLRRVTGVSGVSQFMVALTNNTLFTRSLVVGRNKVFEVGQGYTTNFMSYQKLLLGPRCGQVVAVEPPTNGGPWLLGVGHRRVIGPAEFKTRVRLANLKLFKSLELNGDWPVEYIEVEK